MISQEESLVERVRHEVGGGEGYHGCLRTPAIYLMTTMSVLCVADVLRCEGPKDIPIHLERGGGGSIEHACFPSAAYVGVVGCARMIRK